MLMVWFQQFQEMLSEKSVLQVDVVKIGRLQKKNMTLFV